MKNLEQVVRFVQHYIGKDMLKDLMRQNLGDFSQTGIEELRELKQSVKSIEEYIGKEETKKRMSKDLRYFLRFFSKNKLQELQKELEKPDKRKKANRPFRNHFDSWFEAEVFYKIAGEGYWVIPQYEVSGKKIDMIVIGYKRKLVVECDGKRWHSGEERERRDYNRQKELEKLGWEFWRVSDREFYKNKKSSLKGLWEKLDKMKIYPLKWWKEDKKPSFLKRYFSFYFEPVLYRAGLNFKVSEITIFPIYLFCLPGEDRTPTKVGIQKIKLKFFKPDWYDYKALSFKKIF